MYQFFFRKVVIYLFECTNTPRGLFLYKINVNKRIKRFQFKFIRNYQGQMK